MSSSATDLFERLAATDWSCRFESFSARDFELLALYDELASDLGRAGFFSQPQTLSVKAADDGSYEKLEHAGADALRSMTMTFRQLWSPKEPARFQKILAVLRTHALSEQTTDLLDEIGVAYRRATRQVHMKHVWKDDPMGAPIEEFRASDIIDDWFYSGPFHTDRTKQARVNSWSPTAYEWSLIKAINEIAGVMWQLRSVVAGVLAAATVST